MSGVPIEKARPAEKRHETLSGLPVERLYGPEDLKDFEPAEDLGEPGAYPYVRGVHADMYRGRLWTMRQFAGFGTPEDTNRRFRYLLAKGQTGLSTAFDMPTLMGLDSDAPLSLGEVGREGVAVCTLEDMETLFRGIPLDRVSTSMTINGPAAMVLAFYIVAAENQGVAPAKLRGTLQNDILKEYIAQKEWIYPPRPSLRIITDMLAYGTAEMPLWNTISISGYHIREAGSTAVQELAFTLADGFAYVEAGIEAGLDVDDFAPRLSFFFNAHNHFFEEIAKYRAARRIWARHMREKYGARKERSWTLRFHTQTAGCTLTAQQPENNIVRVAFQALAAVLGGTQSLHTNSMDEALALPTEKAVQIALRTQQIIAHETGVPSTADPLGGSWFVEDLTNRMEAEAELYFREIEERGGVVAGIEQGFFQKEIADAAWRYQQQVEEGEEIIVGVNDYVDEEGEKIPTLEIHPEVERDQVERLRRFRERRDAGALGGALARLKGAAGSGENLMPVLIDCVRKNATLGEMCDVLRGVYGQYREPAVF
ncbi:MAG: methylmalonyl-CoA mutase family protein [Candidatus Eisenbacteria bacterium]